MSFGSGIIIILIVVDPALSKPVIEYLKANNLNLEAILQTHHHSDHIGGTKDLINEWPNVKVIASAKEKDRIPFQNLSVSDGEKLRLFNKEVQVIEVIGHTRSHIAFYKIIEFLFSLLVIRYFQLAVEES